MSQSYSVLRCGENNSDTYINLLISVIDGRSKVESVPVKRLPNNSYMILGTPGLAPGLAKGDQINITHDHGDYVDYVIVQRSGFVGLQIFFEKIHTEEEKRIINEFLMIGGEMDGGMDVDGVGCLRIFNVKIQVGFKVIEECINRVNGISIINQWLYANIYDVKDGVTPLNWWQYPISTSQIAFKTKLWP